MMNDLALEDCVCVCVRACVYVQSIFCIYAAENQCYSNSLLAIFLL